MNANVTETLPSQADVVIVGGGPAGLQAALTLGRVHRRALLLDSGEYRNAPASHLHNLIGSDGRPPADLRAAALAELTAYPTVEVRHVRVTRVRPDGAGFVVTTEAGEVSASAVVLATGVRDELPAIDGLADLWGDLVAHCPFCHGHELAGRTVGILGADIALHLGALMRPVASDLVVLTGGAEPDEAVARALTAVPARVVSGPVRSVSRHGDGLRLHVGDGTVDLGGLFVRPELRQRAPFAEQLGLRLNPSGCVEIDEFGRTSLPGVLAAGDMAHLPAYPQPMASVSFAIASGQLAASSAIAALLTH